LCDHIIVFIISASEYVFYYWVNQPLTLARAIAITRESVTSSGTVSPQPPGSLEEFALTFPPTLADRQVWIAIQATDEVRTIHRVSKVRYLRPV